MSVVNHTPFPALAFRQYNLAGDLNGVVTVRGTFKLTQNGPLHIAEQQEPLVMVDQYAGDPLNSNLLRQSDLVPFKPGSDITFIGAAYAPDGKPERTWTCGLTVGPVSKDLRVFAARHWQEIRKGAGTSFFRRHRHTRRTGWTMGEAEPAPYVVLGWDNAFGGKIPSQEHDSLDACLWNPLGRGVVNDAVPDEMGSVPAPQIEAIENAVTDWALDYTPENIAPIPPFWRQRQQYAGTYDEDWLQKRHPLLPTDFDFRFWQCAHPDLIAEPWLEGHEAFELRNLIYARPVLRGRLPGLKLRMKIDRNDFIGTNGLVLDGVHFDMRPGVGRVFLTWRTAFPWPDGRGMPELFVEHRQEEAIA